MLTVLCYGHGEYNVPPNRYTTEQMYLYILFSTWLFFFFKKTPTFWVPTWIFQFIPFFIEDWNLSSCISVGRKTVLPLFNFLTVFYMQTNLGWWNKSVCCLLVDYSFYLTWLLCEKWINKIRWTCHLQYIFKNSPLKTLWISSVFQSKTKMHMHNSLGLQISIYFIDTYLSHIYF